MQDSTERCFDRHKTSKIIKRSHKRQSTKEIVKKQTSCDHCPTKIGGKA